MDFTYLNGRKGRVVILPQVKSLPAFMEQARKLRWIDGMLDHLAAPGFDKDDAAEWLSYFLGEKYDVAYTVASEVLGLPLVERLDDVSALAMWSDANINVTQQPIIKKHLRFHFGKCLFIPEECISKDGEHYSVPTSYSECKYYKKVDRSQKPERCSYWCRDASIVISKELERLLDYSNNNLESTNILNAIVGGCTIIAGADHGQGAWRLWIKICTMSGTDFHEKAANDASFDPKTAYITSQVAHITCKKDHHEILAGSVSTDMSAAYEKLLSSTLVF